MQQDDETTGKELRIAVTLNQSGMSISTVTVLATARMDEAWNGLLSANLCPESDQAARVGQEKFRGAV